MNPRYREFESFGENDCAVPRASGQRKTRDRENCTAEPDVRSSPSTLVRAVPRFALSGRPEVIKEQIDALRGLDVDEIILAVPRKATASREEVICDLMPLLAAISHRRGCPDLRIVKGGRNRLAAAALRRRSVRRAGVRISVGSSVAVRHTDVLRANGSFARHMSQLASDLVELSTVTDWSP
jgi:hypothetical protein